MHASNVLRNNTELGFPFAGRKSAVQSTPSCDISEYVPPFALAVRRRGPACFHVSFGGPASVDFFFGADFARAAARGLRVVEVLRTGFFFVETRGTARTVGALRGRRQKPATVACVERLRSVLVALASRLAFVAAVVAVPCFAAFVLANGVWSSALPGLLTAEAVGLALVLRRRPPSRRGLQLALAGAVLIAGVVALRLTTGRDSSVRVCWPECEARGAWWLRLFDEHQTVQAGLVLSRALAVTDAREFDEFREVFRRAYGSTPEGGPNALLLASRPSCVASLRYEPPGTEPLPTIVFLHGFGGLLTPFVEVMARGLQERFLIVAPALDPVGAWRSQRGQAVLQATLDGLPPRADRSRVYLVGLSNGALGAVEAMMTPALRAQFAGVVLVSGIGFVPPALALEGTRVLVVAGDEDTRFPIEFVTARTAELRARGADVEAVTLPAGHGLILSHTSEWLAAFERWH